MPEPGLYALTRALIGGIAAVSTGPTGSIDIPENDLVSSLAGNGRGIIAEVRGDQRLPDYVVLSDNRIAPVKGLPSSFVTAVLAAEDTRFGSHPGVDPLAVASATIDMLGGDVRGGSTLTQQLVKNAVIGPERNFERKLIEGALAVRVSQAMPADLIFESYLAHAWFGRGAHGAVDAARQWFGKRWADIDVAEAALLAGLLKGPGYYDPERHPERALLRRNTVLQRMRDEGVIDYGTYAVAVATPISVIPADRYEGQNTTWTEKAIEADLAALNTDYLPSQGFDHAWVATSISPDWQAIAETALVDQLVEFGGSGPVGQIELPPADDPDRQTVIRERAAEHADVSTTTGRAIDTGAAAGGRAFLLDRGYGPLETVVLPADRIPARRPRDGDVWIYDRSGGQLTLRALPFLTGAAVVMDSRTGAILASVGGGLPADVSGYDRTRAERQPGSAIKPFLWVSAIESGFYADTIVSDIEQVYDEPDGQVWKPRNADHSQRGDIPLFVALEKSSNNVAAWLIHELGVYALASIAERAGVYPDGMPRQPAAALGAMETSLTNLVAGYAVILNGGFKVTPHAITALGVGGETLWTPDRSENLIMWQAAAQDVAAMMYGVVRRGTAAGVFPASLHIAGKTGTSSEYRDAWFIGGNPEIVIGVWVGRDDNKPLPRRATGAKAAAPAVKAMFQQAVAQGLLDANGRGPDARFSGNWPPPLHEAAVFDSSLNAWWQDHVPQHYDGNFGALTNEPSTGRGRTDGFNSNRRGNQENRSGTFDRNR